MSCRLGVSARFIVALLVPLLLFFLSGCIHPESKVRQAADRFFAAWERGDAPAMYASLSTTGGVGDFTHAFRSGRVLFPTRRFVIDSIVLNGDRARVSYRVEMRSPATAASTLIIDRLSYPPSCVQENNRMSQWITIHDSLPLLRVGDQWLVDFQNEDNQLLHLLSDFREEFDFLMSVPTEATPEVSIISAVVAIYSGHFDGLTRQEIEDTTSAIIAHWYVLGNLCFPDRITFLRAEAEAD